jgi:hypothetical protein
MVSLPKSGVSVLVVWEDSYGCSRHWEDLSEEGEPSPLLCQSLGWVGRKSKRFVVIIPHRASSADLEVNQGCGDMTIPIAAIRSCKRVRLP